MKLSRSFKWIVSVLMLPFMGIIIFTHQDDFIFLFKQLNPSLSIVIYLIQASIIAISGFPFYILMKMFGYDIRVKDWIGLSFIANLLNQLLPYRPGLAFRFIYLKKHYKILLKHYSFITLFYFFILMSTAFIMVLLPQWFIELPPFFNHQIVIMITLVICSMLILGLAITLLSKYEKAKQSEASWSHMRLHISAMIRHPKTMLPTIFCFLVIQGLSILNFHVIFQALGIPIELSHTVIFVGIFTLGMLFPVTPGNIGLLEILLGGITEALYGQFSLGFSAILLYRAAQLLVGLTFGSLFCVLLLGHIPTSKKALSLQQ